MAKEKKQTFAHDLATAEGQVERQASALRIWRILMHTAQDIDPETLFLWLESNTNFMFHVSTFFLQTAD